MEGRAPRFRSSRRALALALTGAALVTVGSVGPAQASTVPSVSVRDATVVEGESGQVVVKLRVLLSAASSETVVVRFATSDGTATAGSDYVGRTGRVRFLPGQTRRVVKVTVNGDTEPETDETFQVTLTRPTGATLADGTGVATIGSDDDPWEADADGDGWTIAEGDCDDTQPANHPGGEEVVDGIDNDCDHLIDHADSDVPPPDCDDGDPYTVDFWDYAYGCAHSVDVHADHDGDGHVASQVDGPDCDDDDPTVHPGAPEATDDGIDNDCDGRVDEPLNSHPTADDISGTTTLDTTLEMTLTGEDLDGDGLTFAVGPASHGQVLMVDTTGTCDGNVPSQCQTEAVYLPDPGFSGEDTFTYTVADGSLESAPATVTITVLPWSIP